MKVIVIGAGRMGVRHIQGILTVENVEKVSIVDIYETALENAKSNLKDNDAFEKCDFILTDEIDNQETYDVGIIASTANNRAELFDKLVGLGCKDIMVEKPLGQSYQEVLDFSEKVSKSGVNCCVNLNMRMYDDFVQLRKDFATVPQLKGFKTISMNAGTIGIGANGIHYLDLLFFLLDADDTNIKAGFIDDVMIESPRGEEFGDFGGWVVIDYLKQEELVGTAFISISSRSTVFGSWEFVAPHGRIHVNEVEQKRSNVYRKEDSNLPMYRYFGDYNAPVEVKINSPFLGDLTAKWIIGLQNGEQLLPSLSESCKVHKLMFDWLNYSASHQDTFPIT